MNRNFSFFANKKNNFSGKVNLLMSVTLFSFLQVSFLSDALKIAIAKALVLPYLAAQKSLNQKCIVVHLLILRTNGFQS